MSEREERRAETRKVVTTFILVHDLKKQNLLGYLRDLTLKGVQVNGEKKLKIDTQLTLSFELPCDNPRENLGNLNIPAKVKRCIKVIEAPDTFEIGFEFTQLTSEQKEYVEKFLARYQF